MLVILAPMLFIMFIAARFRLDDSSSLQCFEGAVVDGAEDDVYYTWIYAWRGEGLDNSHFVDAYRQFVDTREAFWAIFSIRHVSLAICRPKGLARIIDHGELCLEKLVLELPLIVTDGTVSLGLFVER